MQGRPRLLVILDELVERWCDRRALKALSITLPAYLALSDLNDATVELYQALRTTRALAREELAEGESELLGEAIAIVSEALRIAGVFPG